MSLTPEIKIGVLLRRSPAGAQVLATWAWSVVPVGMPLRGPDMSCDMRLSDVSIETPDSDGSETVAVGLSDPLGSGATDADSTAAYVAPPRMVLVAGCRRQLVRPWLFRSRAEART